MSQVLGLASQKLWLRLVRVCLTTLLAATATAAYAGAYTFPKGTGQAIAQGLFTQGSRSFDINGTLLKVPAYRKFELPVLIEYGITDWLTVLLIPSLLHVSVDRPSSSEYTGIGYTEFGARARVVEGDWGILSFQGTTRIPAASNKTDPAQIGNTDTQLDGRVLLSTNFMLSGWPAFTDTQIGYRSRAGDPPNEVRFDATVGFRPKPEWLVLLQSFNVFSDGKGQGVFLDQTRYSKAQASVVWDFTKNWSVQLGGVTTIAGRNALQELGLVTGLWYRF